MPSWELRDKVLPIAARLLRVGAETDRAELRALPPARERQVLAELAAAVRAHAARDDPRHFRAGLGDPLLACVRAIRDRASRGAFLRATLAAEKLRMDLAGSPVVAAHNALLGSVKRSGRVDQVPWPSGTRRAALLGFALRRAATEFSARPDLGDHYRQTLPNWRDPIHSSAGA